ncbi:helicase [Seminavis robusta]|uniref:Helicase n=1 Tax=Seminavis robusta TaxID=568900 RepID=A0A9N8HK95_9STRA|nr:helicase [Seminavis robusta]|eukprot:Sro716_g191840.1 helicase (874) ;mRNA; r:6270-8891
MEEEEESRKSVKQDPAVSGDSTKDLTGTTSSTTATATATVTTNDNQPDDGIKRVSWDEFLRIDWGPKKKKRRKVETAKSKEDTDTQDAQPAKTNTSEVDRRKKKRKRKLSSGVDQQKNHASSKKKAKFDKEERKQASWETYFEQMREYRDSHGNTTVPNVWQDQQFADWVREQRVKFSARRNGDVKAMSDNRFAALESLGFEGKITKEWKKESFDQRLDQLNRFKRKFHHTKVPKGYNGIPGLRQWVIKTRKKYRGRQQGIPSDLTNDQVDMLDEIGFWWNDQKNNGNKNGTKHAPDKTDSIHPKDHSGDEGGQELETPAAVATSKRIDPPGEKINDPGTPPVAKNGAVGASADGALVKREGKENSDDEENIQKKHESDPVESQHTSEFETRFAQLKAFGRQFNHFRVPKDHASGLRKWIVRIRKKYKEKKRGNQSDLTDEQINRLNALGFNWKKKADTGSNENSARRVGDAVQNKDSALADNCGVAPEQSAGGDGNGVIDNQQRGGAVHTNFERENEKLRTSSLANLQKKSSSERSSVAKQPCEVSFTERIAQLKAVQHGISPETGKQDEFTPKVHITSWSSRFRELQQYESKHGTTRVPSKYEQNQPFASWVWETRKDFSLRWTGDHEALSDERFKSLKKLGFEAFKMNELSPSFAKRLSQLEDFFGVFGHAAVPKTYTASPGLRDWLKTVRSQYKQWEEGDPSVFSLKELEALNALTFEWLGRKPKFASQKKSPPSNSPGSQSTAGSKAGSPRNGRAGTSSERTTEPGASAAGNTSAAGKKYIPWSDRIRKLKAFKESVGHTRVPSAYPEDQGFANWVIHQRKLFTKRFRGDKSAISDERFEELQKIGLNAAKSTARGSATSAGADTGDS